MHLNNKNLFFSTKSNLSKQIRNTSHTKKKIKHICLKSSSFSSSKRKNDVRKRELYSCWQRILQIFPLSSYVSTDQNWRDDGFCFFVSSSRFWLPVGKQNISTITYKYIFSFSKIKNKVFCFSIIYFPIFCPLTTSFFKLERLCWLKK